MTYLGTMRATPWPFAGAGPTVGVDMFDLNPYVQLMKVAHPLTAGDLGRVPTMFSTGDLPPFTASGVDPELLRTVPWEFRHAAAMNPDRSAVLEILQGVSDDVFAADRWQTDASAAALADYRDRVFSWATAAPVQGQATEVVDPWAPAPVVKEETPPDWLW